VTNRSRVLGRMSTAVGSRGKRDGVLNHAPTSMVSSSCNGPLFVGTRGRSLVSRGRRFHFTPSAVDLQHVHDP
jgi:hypothetical protein